MNKIFSQLCEILSKKWNEMNQREIQRNQMFVEQQRKKIEDSQSVVLRKRWASTLNSLPVHIRICSNEIDSCSLSNKYLNPYWEISIPVPAEINRSRCRYLQAQVTEILRNQSSEAYSIFQQRIYDDANEYARQLSILRNGGRPTIDESVLISNYSRFADANYYRLINIEVVTIDCVQDTLFIKYKVDMTSCAKFHGNNYFMLIGQR